MPLGSRHLLSSDAACVLPAPSGMCSDAWPTDRTMLSAPVRRCRTAARKMLFAGTPPGAVAARRRTLRRWGRLAAASNRCRRLCGNRRRRPLAPAAGFRAQSEAPRDRRESDTGKRDRGIEAWWTCECGSSGASVGDCGTLSKQRALSPGCHSRHKISWSLSVGLTLRVRRNLHAEREDYTAAHDKSPAAFATRL